MRHVLFAALLAALCSIAVADYDPVYPPHTFVVNVTLDGSTAPDGTTVSPYVNGTLRWENGAINNSTTSSGVAIVNIGWDNGTDPQTAARNGDTIVFLVNGVTATSSPSSLVYQQGNTTNANLTATSPPTNVTLVSPANNTNTSSLNINFTFKYESQGAPNMTCILGIDGNAANNNSSTQNNTNTVLNSTAPPGRHYWNVTCTNGTTTANSAIRNFTIDNSGPTVAYANVTDADNFYSAWAGNDIIHIRVNATDNLTSVSYITANMTNAITNLTLATFNLTYNSSSGFWEYPYNASTNITWYKDTNGSLNASFPVLGHVIFITPVDILNNTPAGPPAYIEVLLHDLGSFQGPPAGMRGCFQEGTEADGQTNFTKVLDFNSVNLVMVGYMNGSQECHYNMTGNNQTAPWGDTFQMLGKFNFTSVNISTQEKASAVMGAMGNIIQIRIAPPHSFQASRIYVNTTALSALNTTATVSMYNLPFGSTPNVTYDGGNANVTLAWVQGGFDASYNTTIGNLTLTLAGFSGYNITDEVAPTISVASPVDYYNSSSMVWINYTVNGTGTEVSFVRLEIKNYSNLASMYNYTYNESTDSGTGGTAQCSNVSPGSEVRNCYRSISLGGGTGLANGSYLFNISVWDYGTPPAGNEEDVQRYFTLDNVTPTIALVYPTNGSNLTNGNITFQFNVTDATSFPIGCNLLENGAPTTNTSQYFTPNGSTSTWGVDGHGNGYYTWAVNCTDGVGLSGTSLTYTFLMDSTAPAVVPNSPAPGAATTTLNVTFNWTATDTLRSSITCNLSIDGSVNKSNIAVTNGTWYNTTATTNFSEGSHNWSVSCWDDLDNLNNSMAASSFNVDLTAPVVSASSPANDTNSTSGTQAFVFNATDNLAGTLSCTLYLDGAANTTNSSAANNTATTFTLTGMANGHYSWYVNCSDGANANVSETRALLVDNTGPVLSLLSPVDTYNTTSQNITFNWTATDTYRSSITCNLSIDGSVNSSNIAVTNGTWFNTTATTNFSEANHNWSVTCWDDLGNSVDSGARSLRVDLTAPIVSPNSPTALTNTSNRNVSFNWTATDALFSTLYCNLSIDGAVNQSSLQATNGTPYVAYATSNFSDGSHNWSVACWDGLNNTNSSMATRAFTVDTSAPTVVFNNPSANDYNTTNTSVRINVTVNGTGTYVSDLYINITSSDTVYNLTQFNNSTGAGVNTAACANSSAGYEVVECAYTASLPTDKRYTVTVTAYDSGGSPGNAVSSTRNFTIDTSGPSITILAPLAFSTLNTNATNLSIGVSETLTATNTSTCQYSLNGTRVDMAAACGPTEVNLTNGIRTLTVYVNDTLGNEGNASVTFLVDIASNSVLANNTTTLTDNKSVVVASNSPSANISLGNASTNVTLNVSAVYNSSTYNATITNPITVNASTSLGAVIVQMPANVTISASSDWSGALSLPSVQAVSISSITADSGYSVSAVNAGVALGYGSVQLNFSKAVRLLLPGMAGKYAGYIRGSTFTKITAACSADTQAAGDALAAGAECKIDSGSGLAIWTKHFTTFVAFSQDAVPSGTTVVIPSSGGGSVGGGLPVSSKKSADYEVDIGIKTCKVSLTREISSATGQSTLTTTLENAGGEGCAMTDFVFADTIPEAFANVTDISFTPIWSTKNNSTVAFNFPAFAPGESKTITYSVNRWAKPSSVDSFTSVSLSAAKQAAAPAPVQQNVTAPEAKKEQPKPEVKPEAKKPAAAATNETGAAATQPAGAQPQAGAGLGSGAALAAIGLAVLLVLGLVAYWVFIRKGKGLKGV